MKLQITIDMDNDVFTVDPQGELSRILRHVDAAVSRHPFTYDFEIGLYDSNGNGVGSCVVSGFGEPLSVSRAKGD